MLTRTPVTPTCSFCGRQLSDSESIARQAGPECAGKLEAQLSAIAQAVVALAQGYKDPVLRSQLDRLRTAELCLERAVERGWPERSINDIRRDIRQYRACVERRVTRLAEREAERGVAVEAYA